MMYLTASAFADAVSVDRRHAREVLQRASEGKPWHGELLPVIQIEGQRGGKTGVTYALDPLHLSPGHLAKYPQLRALRDEAAATVPAPVAVRSSVEPWRANEGQRRLDIIRSLLDTAKGSRARGKVLRKIVAKTDVEVDQRTLQRWLSDYERRGLIGLLPKPNGNPGKRRVEVTRAWDDGIDLDDAARAAVVARIETYTKTMIAKGWSLAKVSRGASLELADLCRDAGSEIGPRKLGQLCRLNTKFVMRFKDKRRVARHDLDNKTHFDKDKPRISRGRCAWPMELVYGDVHPIDIYVPVPNGKG